MKKSKSFKIILDPAKKRRYNRKLSGAGSHDSRPKRLRTRREILKKEIEERK
jgi:hypothetical protein